VDSRPFSQRRQAPPPASPSRRSIDRSALSPSAYDATADQERELAECRRSLGDSHPDTLLAANNLGLLY